ncbi:MAG: hypothetical protein WC528_01945 [Patescibacteria group bacterium]
MDSLFFILYFCLIIVIVGTAAWAGIKAAPWVPTRQKDIKRMLELARIKPSDLVYDLGAGDGRLVVAVAKEYPSKVVGFELSVLPYLVARLRVRLAGFGPRTKILFKDFYHYDVSGADVILCFLTPKAMSRLSPKFSRELKSGARIISYAFKIKDWPIAEISKPQAKDTPIFLHVKK